MDSQAILKALFVVVIVLVIVTIRIYLNQKKQQEIASYLSGLSCHVCGSNQLYVDARTIRGFLSSGTFSISCFDCGHTWKPSDIDELNE